MYKYGEGKQHKTQKLKFIACFFGNLFAHFQSLGENGSGNTFRFRAKETLWSVCIMFRATSML